jgi:very-short-patch-repair endonuclease
LKFRRQHPIGPYIVDFFSPEANLIVELDEDRGDEQKKADARRQAYLERQGRRVLRFNNEDVLEDAGTVAMTIALAAGIDWT